MKFELYGVETVQNDLQGLLAIFRPGKGLDAFVKETNDDVWRYERRFIHKDTRSAYNATTKTSEVWRGEIFFDPGYINPKSKNRPAEYMFYENARGGSHAIMDRTYAYAQKVVTRNMMDVFK